MRQISRRGLLFGAVAVSALAAGGTALGQAAPVLQPYEQALGNAIGRWTGRVSAVGVAANDNAVRLAVANELSWAGRAAPVLKTFGKYMGAVSAGLVLFEVAKYVVADTSLATIFSRNDNAGTMPGSYATIIAAMPRDGVATYTSGSTTRTFRLTWELPPYSSTKYQPTWNFVQQQNTPDMDAAGRKAVLWEKTNQQATTWVTPTRAYADVQAEVAALDPATHIDPATAAVVLKQALVTARNALADKTGFPDPAIYPPTSADIDPTLWTAPLLAGATAADRDPNLGTAASTGPGAGTGTDPGTQFDPGPVPTASPIPNLGDLPWPTWHIADAPPVAASCTDPTLDVALGSVGFGLSDVTLTAGGWCNYGNAAAVFTRPFMLGAVTLGSIILALRDR